MNAVVVDRWSAFWPFTVEEMALTPTRRFPNERAEAFVVGGGIDKVIEFAFVVRTFHRHEAEFGIANRDVVEIIFPVPFSALVVAGHADDIELGFAGEEIVHPVSDIGIVAAEMAVQRDGDFWIELADSQAAGVDELGEIVKIGAAAIRKKQTVGGLVSDGDHVGWRAIFLQALEDGGGPVVNRLYEFVEGIIGPGGGFGLLAGAGPGVAIVVAQEKFQAGLLNAGGEFFGVLEIAEGLGAARGKRGVAAGSAGIDENAGADGIDMVGLEDLEEVFFSPRSQVSAPWASSSSSQETSAPRI